MAASMVLSNLSIARSSSIIWLRNACKFPRVLRAYGGLTPDMVSNLGTQLGPVFLSIAEPGFGKMSEDMLNVTFSQIAETLSNHSEETSPVLTSELRYHEP